MIYEGDNYYNKTKLRMVGTRKGKQRKKEEKQWLSLAFVLSIGCILFPPFIVSVTVIFMGGLRFLLGLFQAL